MEAGDIALLGECFPNIYEPWVQYPEPHRPGTIFLHISWESEAR